MDLTPKPKSARKPRAKAAPDTAPDTAPKPKPPRKPRVARSPATTTPEALATMDAAQADAEASSERKERVRRGDSAVPRWTQPALPAVPDEPPPAEAPPEPVARVRRAEDCERVTAVLSVSTRTLRLPRAPDAEACALRGFFRAYDDGAGPRVRVELRSLRRCDALNEAVALTALRRAGLGLHYGARLTLFAPDVRASRYTLVRADNCFGMEWLAH